MTNDRSINLTADPVGRVLVRMAAPASIGFFFNTMYNLADTYFGGRISTGALAALSLSFPVFIIVLSIGSGVSSGAGALIANALGAGREQRAVRYQAQAITFGILVSVVASAVIFVLLPWVFRALGATGDGLRSALRYARPLVAGGSFFILNNILNAGLTSRGDTRIR